MSATFFVLLLIFIYSLETTNSYKSVEGEIYLVENMIEETCNVGNFNEGESLYEILQQYSSDIEDYCEGRGKVCNINFIYEDNNQELDNYEFEISFSGTDFTVEKTYTC